jgi:hypothetical protein
MSTVVDVGADGGQAAESLALSQWMIQFVLVIAFQRCRSLVLYIICYIHSILQGRVRTALIHPITVMVARN